jgi:SRSO17 transposase
MNTLMLPKGSPDALPELEAFLAPFAPLFRRSTSRRSMERYITGLPKPGNASVGVQPQYSGTLGKHGNCQIVVSAQYVVDDPATTQPLYWPVSARLYLPQSRAQDPARCQRTHGRSWTGPEGWLIGERPLPDENGELRWFFSSLPADTPISRLVELAHLRWPIEQFYEDAKGECGLDQSQGRTWEGLHRHVALVMLAYTLLILQSLEHELIPKPASGTAFPPARQMSLPACYRQALVLLFQDLVLWLIETKQVEAFRPRRN